MPRWFPFALFAAFIGYIIYLANTRSFPLWFYEIQMDTGIDKAGHFILMGILAWCANHALRWKKFHLGKLGLWAGSTGVFIVTALEEASQHWVPGRHCDWKDLLADVLGIVLIGGFRSHPPSAITNPQST